MRPICRACARSRRDEHGNPCNVCDGRGIEDDESESVEVLAATYRPSVGLHLKAGIVHFELIYCTKIPEFEAVYVL
jgi:hypothetical protein